MANLVNTASQVHESNNAGSVENVETLTMEISTDLASGEVVPTPVPAGLSRLNPLANEWNPSTHKAPEDDRCLYLTFSNGYPLTEAEISSFFVQNFGASVETVYVHRRQKPAVAADNEEPEPPLFGKIVFDSLCMASLIMNGEARKEFVINERTMWCKKFVARAVRHPESQGD